MAEQATCQCGEFEYRDGAWRSGVAYVANQEDDFVQESGYCPTCGTRLNADGTETPMVPAVTPNDLVRRMRSFAADVAHDLDCSGERSIAAQIHAFADEVGGLVPAVTPEAVRATDFYRVLTTGNDARGCNREGHLGALGLTAWHEGPGMEDGEYKLTDHGRTILYALHASGVDYGSDAALAASGEPGGPECRCPHEMFPCPKTIIADYECEGRDDGKPCADDDLQQAFYCWQVALSSMVWRSGIGKPVALVPESENPWMNCPEHIMAMHRGECEWQKPAAETAPEVQTDGK